MKIIRITADNEISSFEYPADSISEVNDRFCELIGNDCDLYEHVMPVRLYSELHHKKRPTKIAGQCVSMLIDEEGFLKEGMEPNLIASYLFETDKYNIPIMGNVLFVGEKWTCDGIEFCGIEESVFKELELQLTNMVYVVRATKEAFDK